MRMFSRLLIGRQRFGMIKLLTETARLHQFKSISYDLIYGLPFQTVDTLAVSLQRVIELSPDRVAFYSYAHLPKRFSSQRAIDRHALPDAKEKVDMLTLITRSLVSAGYEHIGMDHFVKAEDDLALARLQGKLQRNFQGYSTCMAPDLIGLGVSAISSTRRSYAQNEIKLEDYYRCLDDGQLAIHKGVTLSYDDEIRRAVIGAIICSLELDPVVIEGRFNVLFSEYFSRELKQLKPLQNDGLVRWLGDRLVVTDTGRIMLRNICQVFDRYFLPDNTIKFSQSV